MAILGYKNSTRFIRTFGLEEWLRTRGLAGWLEIAIEGLDPLAKQRISDEIGAHYTESVSTHISHGASEQSAQSLALVELGDPQSAACQFEKTHLTESEGRQLAWMEKCATEPLFSFRSVTMMVLDLLPVAGILLLCSCSIYFWRLSSTLWLMGFVCWRLIPRLLGIWKGSPKSFRRVLALSYIITAPAAFLIYELSVYFNGNPHSFHFPQMLIPFWVSSRSTFPIWHKLRNNADDPDVPPLKVV
jgi:hypothetical protein